MTDGGYDEIYSKSACVWGETPGSLLVDFVLTHRDIRGAKVLDVGCGEGKNAIHLSRLLAQVDAFDVSEIALRNAANAWPDSNLVNWVCSGVDAWPWKESQYDLVIAYGLLHCLSSREHVRRIVGNMQAATVAGGTNVLCAFNDRSQDLRPHPGLNPVLLSHAEYRELYSTWVIDTCTDTDLWETHPHSPIRHCHSLTRIIARKPS